MNLRARFDPLLGPLRPVRELAHDAAPPSPPRHGTVFVRVQLRRGWRTISGLDAPERAPVVSIQNWSPRSTPTARILIFREFASVPLRAIESVQAKRPGRTDAGFIPTNVGIIRVWARVEGASGIVGFGHTTRTGEHLGGPTILSGNQIPALEQALAWLARADEHAKRGITA